MKKILNIEIPYGIENPSFMNFEIHEGKKKIANGRLNMDGMAYVEIWNKKSYKLEEVDSSILFDFVNGNKSGEDVAFYLDIARMEVDGIFDGVDDDYQPPHKDAHELYLMHNFWASSMEEVEKKKKKNQKKLKKILLNMILDM